MILTTAYSEYALESYNYSVVDYLLKPIKIERFLKATNKASISILTHPTKSTKSKELQIKHDGMPVNIPFRSILYIQSFGNYLKIFTDARMYLISESLINIIKVLSDDFQHTHKSYITNLNSLIKANRTHLFVDKNEIPVSTMYKVAVFKKLEVLAKL